MDRILEKISGFLALPGQHKVATINPEIALLARQDEEFKNTLNGFDINTCDGFGLVLAAKFTDQEEPARVTGVDLTKALLNDRRFKVFLLGGQPGVAGAVKAKFPEADIVGYDEGGKLEINSCGYEAPSQSASCPQPGTSAGFSCLYKLQGNDRIVAKINASGANMLLVAFGMKRQEMWIEQNLALMPDVKVAIGVGGTFDYLSGKIRRAPAWMRRMGFEWLFRLLREPKRFGRIFNALVKFSFVIFLEKSRNAR